MTTGTGHFAARVIRRAGGLLLFVIVSLLFGTFTLAGGATTAQAAPASSATVSPAGGAAHAPAVPGLCLGANPVGNPGFETNDFSSWTQK